MRTLSLAILLMLGGCKKDEVKPEAARASATTSSPPATLTSSPGATRSTPATAR